ncbi:ABC transporter substrate-binding protein [Pseudomonas sp. GX19020]|uniref:ABC transporter substrate-binding protein n=1 Tax=Pseudomonas sp. GX19020 TaxID=2942277 RepID=UPI002019D70E|nr:ABC transporter substrate-binding protein [Pseudomonas sp. GX19020]MCL4067209.1 ABC transporter substrate-binding protein [Pseudomonas sp. GX19020]
MSHPNSRKRLLTLSSALSLSAILAAAPSLADEITLARGVDADSLDPHRASTTQSLQVTSMIYDTLLTMAADGSIHPGLAGGYEVSEDGLTYRFAIRDGVACHDGSPFDAAAAKISFDRAINPETLNPNLSAWGPVVATAVEDDSLVVTLSEPYGPFASFLTSIQAGFLCPSALSGGEFTPIGTGPFRLEKWVRNDAIVLTANDAYTNVHPLVENPGRPHLDRVTLRVIPEAVARMAALRSGEVDIVEPSLEEAVDLKDDPDFRVYAAEYSGQQVLAAFTWRVAPLDNPEIRRAIGMALNKEAYAEIAYEGLVSATNCTVAPNLFAVDQEKCAEWGVSYDPDAARAVMEAAGYSAANPLKVNLQVHKLPGFDQMHQIMQQDLAEIYVEAEIQTREVAAFFDFMTQENLKTDIKPTIWTMGMSGVDPDYMYFLWKQPGFVSMGVNDTLDAILVEQRRLTGEARAAKVQEAEEYLLSNGYAVPLVSPGWNWLMASSARVEGFKLGHMVSLVFNDVTLAD